MRAACCDGDDFSSSGRAGTQHSAAVLERTRDGPRLLDAFPQPKRVSLAESNADSIARGHRHAPPSAGERIVEMALAERIGVSRVPIREAI
jgi:hypothetical protein